MTNLARLIQQGSRQRGLDPMAVLAVARREGLGATRPGDHGTSFGPFQLHMGGALPRQHYGDAAQWASSPQGIAYALNEIAKVARGKHGRQAVAAIVSQFEKPADIPGEIQSASALLGKFGGGHALPSPSGQMTPPAPGTTPGGITPLERSQGIGRALLAEMGPGPQHGDLGPVMQAIQQKAATHAKQLAKNVEVDTGGQPLAPGAANIIQLAKKYEGLPYKWGGTSPKTGFDCSGFVQWLYSHAGVKIPRTSQQQWHSGKPVERGALQAGDLVFFEPTKTGPGHVGMYIGNGQMIESPHTGASIRISSINRDSYMGARRVGGGKR